MPESEYNPVYYELAISSLLARIEDLSFQYMPRDTAKDLHILTRLISLHTKAQLEGWSYFDWDRASEAGWFSEWDYNNIPALAEYDIETERKRVRKNKQKTTPNA